MTTIRKCEGAYVETDIDDEKVVMNLETGAFFSLRETGREIWSLLGENADRAGVIAAMTEGYAADEEAVARDVDAFLGELRAAGLVETV